MAKKFNVRQIAAILITVAFFVFQVYLSLVRQLPTMLQAPLHLLFALLIVGTAVLGLVFFLQDWLNNDQPG